MTTRRLRLNTERLTEMDLGELSSVAGAVTGGGTLCPSVVIVCVTYTNDYIYTCRCIVGPS